MLFRSVNFRIISSESGHPETGWVTLDYRFGGDRDPLCPPPPPPPPPPTLNVSISGPTQIQPGATCTWDAVLGNGTAPYSYTWYNDNMQVGSGPEYTGSKDPGNLGDHFPIRVHVTDATNAWGETTIVVYENSAAQMCRF